MLYKLGAFLTVFKPYNGNKPTKEVDYFDKKKDMMGVVTIIFMSGSRFLPEALIRSNMSCQIRRLINQGRDRSSPLTDGGMEAGHFLSSSLTFSSTENKTRQGVANTQTVYNGSQHRCSRAACR